MGDGLAGWLGIAASVFGVGGSVLLAIPTFRDRPDEQALAGIPALLKALREDVSTAGDQLERDFNEEILRRAHGNWRHLKRGAIALCIAFVFLLAQSIVVLSTPERRIQAPPVIIPGGW